MERTSIIEDEFAALWYHPDARVVHHEIRSFMPPGYFRRFLTAGAEVLEAHGAQKWLSNDRDSVVIAEEDVEWCGAHWTPRVLEAGFRYWAVVAPVGEVAAAQMEAIVAGHRQQGITTRLFDTADDALDWLKSV